MNTTQALHLGTAQGGAQAAISLAALLLVVVIILILLGLVLLAISLRRRQHFRSGPHSRAAHLSDPWQEAGRRVLPPDASGDDTVDLDPWDLSPDDIGPSGTNGGSTR